jgi:hypothetical protein
VARPILGAAEPVSRAISTPARRVTSKPLQHVAQPVRRLTSKPVQRVVRPVSRIAQRPTRTVERTTRQAVRSLSPTTETSADLLRSVDATLRGAVPAVLEDLEQVGGSVLPVVDAVVPSTVLPLPLPVELPAPVVEGSGSVPSPAVVTTPQSIPIPEHADGSAPSARIVASPARATAPLVPAPLVPAPLAARVPGGQPAGPPAPVTAGALTQDDKPLTSAPDAEPVLQASPSSAPTSVDTGAAVAAAASATSGSFSPATPGLAAEWLLFGGALVALWHARGDGRGSRLFRQPGFCPD